LTALGLARNSDLFAAGVDLHGVHDWYHWTLAGRLAEALRTQGVDYSELVFPDEIHGFLRHASFLKAYTATAKFLDAKLAP